MVVSVDWEGRSLLPENLELIASFSNKHPDVPLIHFLNPAYYTRGSIDAAQTTKAIRGAVLAKDQVGLHVHAWVSLLARAGVKSAQAPQLVEEDSTAARAEDDWGFYPAESGFTTPIEYFDEGELDRILATSTQILAENGFSTAKVFRAGAWISGQKVQAALARNGFVADFSPVDINPFLRRFGEIPRFSSACTWLRALWPSISETSQPFKTNTASGTLWQMPNNATLADYASAEEIVQIFLRNVLEWQHSSEGHCFISTGFHQETAREFIKRIDSAITQIKQIAVEKRIPLVFTGNPLDYV